MTAIVPISAHAFVFTLPHWGLFCCCAELVWLWFRAQPAGAFASVWFQYFQCNQGGWQLDSLPLLNCGIFRCWKKIQLGTLNSIRLFCHGLDASNVSVVLPLFQSIYVTESCSPKGQHYLRFQSREIRLHAYHLLSMHISQSDLVWRVLCLDFGRRKIQDLRLDNLTWHFFVPASILISTSRTNSLYFPVQSNPTWLMTFK